jgi:hypothetical protein
MDTRYLHQVGMSEQEWRRSDRQDAKQIWRDAGLGQCPRPTGGESELQTAEQYITRLRQQCRANQGVVQGLSRACGCSALKPEPFPAFLQQQSI